MGLVKVTGLLDVDDENIDKNDPTGLSQEAYEKVLRMFPSLQDIDTELVEDEELPSVSRPRKKKR